MKLKWARHVGLHSKGKLIRDRESIIRHLAAELQPGDVVITMGAGDIGSLGDALRERLETMRQAG